MKVARYEERHTGCSRMHPDPEGDWVLLEDAKLAALGMIEHALKVVRKTMATATHHMTNGGLTRDYDLRLLDAAIEEVSAKLEGKSNE